MVDLGQLRMLSLIVEQVGVGVAAFDNDALFLYANATFAEMHRCTVDQLRTDGFKGASSTARPSGTASSKQLAGSRT